MTNTDKAWEEMVEAAAKEICSRAYEHGAQAMLPSEAREIAKAALQAAGVKELVEAASEANRRYQLTGALIVDNADDKFAMRKLNAALSDKGDR